MGNDTNRTDTGAPTDQYETKGSLNMYLVGSTYQKAIRRGDRELAMFSAFELLRSGMDGFFHSRVSTILLEDLRLRPAEAHLLPAIKRLQDMMNDVFEDDDGMRISAGMRIASLMAEAESSRGLLPMKNWWLSIAEDRLESIENGEEPEHGFPIDDKLDEIEYVVSDQHVARGSRAGRGTAHYLIEAARTSDPSGLETRYKRLLLEHELGKEVSDEQVEHSVKPVPEDEPWEHSREVGFPRH